MGKWCSSVWEEVTQQRHFLTVVFTIVHVATCGSNCEVGGQERTELELEGQGELTILNGKTKIWI